MPRSTILRTAAGLLVTLFVPLSLQSQIAIRPPAAPRNQESLSPISLNHLFIVLDPKTYEDIGKSDFLHKEFAPMEQRATVRTDQSYRGTYIYGFSTYMEFFQSTEAAARGFKLNDAGIALGLESPGAIVELQAKMAAKIPAHQSTITRQYSDEQLPWFYLVEPRDFPFRTWVMEYHPSFLAQWNPSTVAGANEGISRSQVIDRYKSVIDDAPKDPCFRDISAVTLAVNKETISRLTQLYQLWGMRMRTKGGIVSLESSELAVHLIPETATARGIQQIEFRLNRMPKDPSPRHFGEKSILSFQGKVGTWTF
ncbi:MAG: DUF5829 family protein [Bryobacteraceae bacterium]